MQRKYILNLFYTGGGGGGGGGKKKVPAPNLSFSKEEPLQLELQVLLLFLKFINKQLTC